jgi:hypothetical protein
MSNVGQNSLSLDGRGHEDLAIYCLGGVGVGARAAGSPAKAEAPTQDLLSAKALSQVFLSRQGREDLIQ